MAARFRYPATNMHPTTRQWQQQMPFFRITSKNIGDKAEDVARNYLQQHGIKILESNFRCKAGEIDIIAVEAETLLFIEVKYRKNNTFGTPQEMVTTAKQRKIVTTAALYLQKHAKLANKACRFDVISIQQNEINWIKAAFDAY